MSTNALPASAWAVTSPPGNALLEIRCLVKDYLGERGLRTRVVNQVSFTVESGAFFTLLGPSGCGKTTTLRSIAGLERPDAGSIVYAGRSIYSSEDGVFVPASQRQIGMVFQSYAIWPHMTVFQNAAFPLDVSKRYSRSEISERVMRILHVVALDGLEERNATQLSGGQQQRLALARALVNEPKLLLLDEPLSNLDAKLRARMRFELKRLQRDIGLTMVYVTHDQSEALALSDQIAVMKDGEIVQVGGPREIYQRPASRYVADFVGTTNFIGGKIARGVAGGRIVDAGWGMLACHTVIPFAEGESVEVSVRPEHVRLHAAAADDAATFPATVENLEFLGDHAEVEIRAGEKVLVAHASPGVVYAAGDTVHFSIAPEHCAVFRGPSAE